MAKYRMLFKELRNAFSVQDLDDLCYELGYSPGEVFTQPGNLSRMSQDLQEFARRRGQEQELLQAVHAARPHSDLSPYGYVASTGSSNTNDTPAPTSAGSATTTESVERKLYVSYAWGGESEEIVNKIDTAFQNKGITLVRDKRDLGYRGSIREFMKEIGKGRAVVAIISKKYLQSENCMFELTQIAQNKDFYDRIFPIILGDANIYKAVDRIKYITYWDERIKELNEAILESTKGGNLANIQRFTEELSDYADTRSIIDELTFVLKDMNALTPEIHERTGFDALINDVEAKLAE